MFLIVILDSMDGDIAPLADITKLAAKYDAQVFQNNSFLSHLF